MDKTKEILEDREMSYRCDDCGGSITFDNGFWTCDGCEYYEEDNQA